MVLLLYIKVIVVHSGTSLLRVLDLSEFPHILGDAAEASNVEILPSQSELMPLSFRSLCSHRIDLLIDGRICVL